MCAARGERDAMRERDLYGSWQGRKGESHGFSRCRIVYARARMQTMLTRDAKLNER